MQPHSFISCFCFHYACYTRLVQAQACRIEAPVPQPHLRLHTVLYVCMGNRSQQQCARVLLVSRGTAFWPSKLCRSTACGMVCVIIFFFQVLLCIIFSWVWMFLCYSDAGQALLLHVWFAVRSEACWPSAVAGQAVVWWC